MVACDSGEWLVEKSLKRPSLIGLVTAEAAFARRPGCWVRWERMPASCSKMMVLAAPLMRTFGGTMEVSGVTRGVPSGLGSLRA